MKNHLSLAQSLDPSEVLALLGFPEAADFSLENSHFYLDDLRYPAFCVAMQRAHEEGLAGATRGDVTLSIESQHAHSKWEPHC